MPGAVFLEGPAFFPGTFHARGRFPGRSCVFPGDLPCQGPFSRKVLRFSGGPSMSEPVFLEGPAFFRWTFHARARFPGRSCVFQGDLPCQGPFSWKVLRFSGGPSMPEPVFLEGPAFFRWTNCHFALTIHQNGSFGGRTWQVRGWFCQGIGRRACSWSSAENGGRAVIVDNFFSIVHIFCIILYPGKF